MLKELLNYKLDINKKDKDGNTSLHIACKKGNKDILNLLLNFRADTNIQNKFGYKPI